MDIDPELPWGNWHRIEGRSSGSVYVDDATGETWPSLRSALWCGRLGMSTQNGEPPAEVLELVHAVLAATVRREPGYPSGHQMHGDLAPSPLDSRSRSHARTARLRPYASALEANAQPRDTAPPIVTRPSGLTVRNSQMT